MTSQVSKLREMPRGPDQNRDAAEPTREADAFVPHRGDGFELAVPRGATENVHGADDSAWQYRDFLFRVSPEETLESTGAFYFWTRDPPARFDPPSVRTTCRKVLALHLFEGAFRLRKTDCIEGSLGKLRSMVLKFRYRIASPDVEGPIHLFTLYDEERPWLFLLGVFTAQDGDPSREKEIMEMLEHEIVLSFRLCP